MIKNRVIECVYVAEFFRVMNNTAWNLRDDEYNVINRRWFDHWKGHIQYDYIVLKLLEKKNQTNDDKNYLDRI